MKRLSKAFVILSVYFGVVFFAYSSEEVRTRFALPELGPLQWALTVDAKFLSQAQEIAKYIDDESGFSCLIVGGPRMSAVSIQVAGRLENSYEVVFVSLDRETSELTALRRPVTDSLFQRISKFWQSELMAARFEPDPPQLGDGAYYHFSGNQKGVALAAKVASTVDWESAPELSVLIASADALISLAKNNGIAEEEVFRILEKIDERAGQP